VLSEKDTFVDFCLEQIYRMHQGTYRGER